MNIPIFAVQNEVQKALFEKELKGQLSDGAWENARPGDHWKNWCQATIVVDPVNPGYEGFYPSYTYYGFSSPMLWECVGDRMMKIAQAVVPDISEKQVKRELRALSKLTRTRRS